MRARKIGSADDLPYTAQKKGTKEAIPYIAPVVSSHDRAPIVCVILYIACVALGCVGDWSRLAGGIGTYMKAASLGAVGLAGFLFVKTGEVKGLGEIGRFAVLLIGPILITLLMSLVIWVVNEESISAISRGAQKLIFQAVNILSVLAAAYMFKGKTVLYCFLGMMCGNAMICLLEVPKYGVGATIQSLIDGLTGGDTYGFMRAIEIHDITFAAGLFVLYFATAGWKEKNKIWFGLIALVFFIIGFKRIAIPGCAMSILLWWFTEKRTRRTRVRLVYTVSCSMVILAFLYVLFIKAGLFITVMRALGVDMMGRDKIYRYMDSYYIVDPTFIGYGFEYTVAMLRGMRDSGEEILHVTGIHNDLLKLYIELGFWGFLLWTIYVFVYQTRWYMKHYGERAARLMMIVNLYAFITYMTDNTTYYFWMSMAMRAIMIGYCMSGEIVAGRERERRETGILTDYDIKSLTGDTPSG